MKNQKIRDIIFSELNQWVFNTENQAGDKLHVVESSDFQEIIDNIVEKLSLSEKD